MRLAFLVPSRCRLPECMRITFPVAVILNRFAAPRCVLSLSFFTFFATNVSSLNSLLDSASGLSAGGSSRWFHRRAAPALRRQQSHQNICLHSRADFHERVFGNFSEEASHLRAPHFLMGHLASAMKNHGLDLVAFAEKTDDLVLADLVIVLRGCRAKLDFLELRAL